MGFFSKHKQLVSPLNGECILVENANDPVFKEKVLGDGVAIIPTDGTVVSPCEGTIAQVAHTKHAICIESSDGLEILIHLGMDTVGLEGEGFEVFVEVGDKVSSGQKLATMDLDFIKSKELETLSPCIITNMDTLKDFKCEVGAVEAGKSAVIKYKL